MEATKETINLNIICPDPTCATRKEIAIPWSSLSQSESGIVTISISKGLVCNHSFQVFVDKSGRVRGYKKPDLELTFTPVDEEDERSNETRIQEQDRVLQGLQVILGDEMLLKLVRTSLGNLPIYTITDIPSISTMMTNLKHIVDPYVNEFTVCSLQEYNQKHRTLLSLPGYDDAFVIAIDQHIIINQTYDNKFKEKDYAFERSLLRMIDFDKSNESISKEFHSLFDHIIDVATKLKDEFHQDKFSNKKDVSKRISKLTVKKLAFDVDSAKHILRNRLDFDMDEYFKERSRASEWGKGILDLTG
ncbi:MAG: hypothetical protein ACFFE2_16350 [Candidatus Thorarchaeota archaeon]